MSKRPEKNLIVGMDVGTTKIVTLVAEAGMDGVVEIIGIGSHPSHGLKRGVVVNIDSTVQSMKRSVEEAELMAGCQINSVAVGIAGSHIRSQNSVGVVAIKDREVTQSDVDRVIDTAKAVTMPPEQRLLHVLPQEFIIDEQEGITEPIGMSGVRMEAKVHLVTGAVSAAQNIVKCVRRCGLEVENFVLEQLASSYAVLSDDEKELGVCLVDIGGGTTDIAVFIDGAIAHTAVIPIAGEQVTNDIAIALRTPTASAEEIKIKHGVALRQMTQENDEIDVPTIGDGKPRKLTAQNLADVIEPRFEELFLLVQGELRRSGFAELIASGIVLTGGSSKLRGVVELGEEIFHMPVRIGTPRFISGLSDVVKNPMHATGVGLLLYSQKSRSDRGQVGFAENDSAFGSVWTKLRSWFQGNF